MAKKRSHGPLFPSRNLELFHKSNLLSIRRFHCRLQYALQINRSSIDNIAIFMLTRPISAVKLKFKRKPVMHYSRLNFNLTAEMGLVGMKMGFVGNIINAWSIYLLIWRRIWYWKSFLSSKVIFCIASIVRMTFFTSLWS